MGTALWVFVLPALLFGLVTMPTPAEGLQETELSVGSSETDSSDSDYIVDWTECGTCVWSIDSEGALVVKPADGNETGNLPSIPWSDYKSKIRSVKFLDMVKASRLWGAFRDMPKLEEVDLSGLDSSNVASMDYMFYGCSSLISLDLSCLDTSSVTSMSYMLNGCYSLSSLNLSNIITSKVTNMSCLFYNCSKLTSLDLTSFNTSSVTDMSLMFVGCSSLGNLNLSGFNTAKVSDMSHMFQGCSALKTINLSSFNTQSVITMYAMFSDCVSLEKLNLSSFDVSCVKTMYAMFSDCSSLTSLDISNFNAPVVQNMAFMFKGCSSLASLDLSSLYAPKAANFSYMFFNCASLSVLDLSHFDSKEIESMKSMFSGCKSLTSLNLSSLDTSNVTNMEGMFWGCSSLVVLDLSGLDTSSVTNMYGMFDACSLLVSLDLSNFDTSSAVDMRSMFFDCDSLIQVSLGSSFSFNGKGESRLVSLPGKWWRSTADRVAYASSEVPNNVAATYRKAEDISSTHVSVVNQVYTGTPLEASITVSLGDGTQLDSENYSVSYEDNVDVGTAKALVTGEGCYAGTIEKSFTILPAAISKAEVTTSENPTYTGSAFTPVPTVKLNNKTLKAGTDYEVAYSNNINAGTATITVTGKGNYAGTATGTFTILPAAISKAEVTTSENPTYTGSAFTPVPTVKLNNKTLKAGTDYEVAYSNNINAGTATITVTGKGNYAGTATGTFTILPADASGSTVKVVDQTYTGAALTPAPTVVYSDKTLREDTDYTVSYSDNVNVGTATVIVSFKGNYTGSAKLTFAILPAPVKPVSISSAVVSVSGQVYTGLALEPSVSVKLSVKTLSKGTDYDVVYSNNVNAGTATVTVTGKGNYTDSCSATFTISPADISGAQVGVDSEQTYTGSALTPVPTVTLSGKTLVQGFDYDVSYSSNVNVGTATVAVTGKGNYMGTTTTAFEIVAPPAPTPDTTPTPSITFLDVNSFTPHNEDISWLASAGVSTGWDVTAGKEFRPYTNVARCDMAAFLYRLAGSPDYTAPGISPFRDCDTSTPHYKEICWLAERGISEGWAVSGGKEFRPYATVARCDMAAFLYRMAGSPNYAAPSTSPFKDCNGSTPHYREVCWLAETGVSAGWDVSGSKEFRSYNTVARCDMAAFLHRMKDKGLV